MAIPSDHPLCTGNLTYFLCPFTLRICASKHWLFKTSQGFKDYSHLGLDIFPLICDSVAQTTILCCHDCGKQSDVQSNLYILAESIVLISNMCSRQMLSPVHFFHLRRNGLKRSSADCKSLYKPYNYG